jgi:hypothetical protein
MARPMPFLRSSKPLQKLLDSLQRFRRLLDAVLKDDWGANAFEELARHVDPVLLDPNSVQAVAALGAQLQASEQAGVLSMSGDLASEGQVLLPLLNAHLKHIASSG